MGERLRNKVAMVTGAGSGIGRATALTFAREGAMVIAADRDLDAVEAVAAEAGAAVEAMRLDVSRAAEVETAVRKTVERHGGIDILVNNAGFGFAATVVDTTEAAWDALMDVNVKGVFLGCKYAIPAMAKTGGGVIVNTASTTARVGIRERAAYCASKGAVASLTRAMALDHVADGIRINCVAPGTIETPYYAEIFERSSDAAELREALERRQAMNRLGQPQEVANAILFLASDESSFCTGSMLMVDGGWTAK